MSDTILTIIIFSYNFKDSISRCIESAVNQKTNYKYEIHLCDDASTDGTSDICREYAKKYPDKIKLFIQENNTHKLPPKQRHYYLAYDRIRTKYWTYIDGDDYYSNENFLQTGISKLEEHSECSMFGADTLYNYENDTKQVSYIHDMANFNNIKSGVFSPYQPLFIHPSARIYRSDFKFHKVVSQLDTFFFYYHLTLGSIYYWDEICSVYNIKDNGEWSKIPEKRRLTIDQTFQFRMCQFLNFKYEDLWLQKIIDSNDSRKIKKYKRFLGTKLGWYYWFARKFVPIFGLKILNKRYIINGIDR